MNYSNLVTENDKVINWNKLFDTKYEIGANLQPKQQITKEHSHEYIEIVCQIRGESKQVVDNKSFMLDEGEILIIHPDQTHYNPSTESEVLNIIISPKFLSNLIIESAYDDNIINIKNILLHNKYFKPFKMNIECITYLASLYNKILSDEPMYYMLQKSLITCFLIELYKSQDLPVIFESSDNFDLINYIKNNLSTATLNDFAKQNNYSPSLMSQKIKKDYNTTFVEILKEYRLKEATRLLTETTMSIESILLHIGYANRTHFYDLFNRKYNTTPSLFRKQHNHNKEKDVN